MSTLAQATKRESEQTPPSQKQSSFDEQEQRVVNSKHFFPRHVFGVIVVSYTHTASALQVPEAVY